MTTITSDVIAKNADKFKTFATTIYDLGFAKNEIDFLVEVVNRLDYVTEFVYGMSSGYLYASFESSPGHSEILERLTSIATIEEIEVEEDVNSYTITIDNL